VRRLGARLGPAEDDVAARRDGQLAAAHDDARLGAAVDPNHAHDQPGERDLGVGGVVQLDPLPAGVRVVCLRAAQLGYHQLARRDRGTLFVERLAIASGGQRRDRDQRRGRHRHGTTSQQGRF